MGLRRSRGNCAGHGSAGTGGHVASVQLMSTWEVGVLGCTMIMRRRTRTRERGAVRCNSVAEARWGGRARGEEGARVEGYFVSV